MNVVRHIGVVRGLRSLRVLLGALVLLASVVVAGTEASAARQNDVRAFEASTSVYTPTGNTPTTDRAKAAAAVRASGPRFKATRHQASMGNMAADLPESTVPRISPFLPCGIAFDSPDIPSRSDPPGGVGIRAPPAS